MFVFIKDTIWNRYTQVQIHKKVHKMLLVTDNTHSGDKTEEEGKKQKKTRVGAS